MYIFKYHPDGYVYRNDAFYMSHDEFKAANPNFPLPLDAHFEYGEKGLFFINDEGHHIEASMDDYQDLIEAIDGL